MLFPTLRAFGTFALLVSIVCLTGVTSAAVDNEATNYGLEFYPYGTATAFAAKEDGKTVITVAISASRFQGQNFKCVF